MHNVGELGLSQILSGVQFPIRLHCHVLITENVQTEDNDLLFLKSGWIQICPTSRSVTKAAKLGNHISDACKVFNHTNLRVCRMLIFPYLLQ